MLNYHGCTTGFSSYLALLVKILEL